MDHRTSPSLMAASRRRSDISILALEPRMMFDGAAVATATDDGHVAEQTTSADASAVATPVIVAPAALTAPREVVFIDPAVADRQVLADAARPDATVVFTDLSHDGLSQIREWLEAHAAEAPDGGWAAIHIVGHGQQGAIRLGDTILDAAAVASRAGDLAAIGACLDPNGDILLYACDVAGGATGPDFVTALARATGADVAASTDTTGAATLGGDWALETTTGPIEAQSFGTGLESYGHALGSFMEQFTGVSAISNTANGYVSSYSFWANSVKFVVTCQVQGDGAILQNGGDWGFSAETLLIASSDNSTSTTEKVTIAREDGAYWYFSSIDADATSARATTTLTVNSVDGGPTYLTLVAGQSQTLSTSSRLVSSIELTSAELYVAIDNIVGQTPADVTAPTVSSVSVPSNATYKAGDSLNFTVNFSEAVTVTGTPRLVLDVGGSTKYATYTGGSGSSALTFTYTSASGDYDSNGISVSSLQTNGGTLKDGVGYSATLTLNSVASTTGVLVDAVVPTVSSVTSSTANGTYKAGDTISVIANFSEAVTVTGTPQLTLETGTTDQVVNYASGSGTSQLVFTYTVQAGDTTSDLDYVSTGALSLNSGTIKDAAGNSATLTLASPGSANSLGANKAIVIDTIAPTVSSVSVPSNSTYIAGQSLSFTVNFNEAVTVTGTPRLVLDIGGTSRYATYVSGSGTSALAFSYTVASGDADGDGIAVSSLQTNGGTLNDAAGNNATLTLNSVGSTSLVRVDTVAPTVSSVSVPSNAGYTTGQNLDFTVNFSEAVTVNTGGGTPYLGVTVGSTTKQASYVSGSGTSALLFRYTVSGGDNDSDGIAVASAWTSNGGTIKDAAGNNAGTSLSSVGATSSVLVDTVAPSVSGNIGVPSSGSYTTGQTLSFTVTFDESVTVTGTDSSLALTIGSTARTATYSSRTTNSITYVYTVQAGDTDADGITIGAISLASTTIRDSVGNDASVSLSGHIPPTSSILIDTTGPDVNSVAVPANGTYIAGQNLDFTVAFSENVTVDTTGGTPRIALVIGSTVRYASYLSDSGTSALVFRHTISSGDTDTNGITVGALATNGGTIKDSAGNAATTTLNSVGSTAAILVDGVAPSVTGTISVPSDGTYVAAGHLDFTITFDDTVTVTGTDSTLSLVVGSTTRTAAYLSSTSTSITYRHSVQSGDNDTDGIAVGSLTLNTTTITDASGQNANVSLTGHVPTTTGIKVDSTAPTVSALAAPTAGTYTPGQNLDFTVTFTESVTISGTPRLVLDVGGQTRYADFVSVSGAAALFRHTVQSGDTDSDGVAVSSLQTNGGTIRDAAGNSASVATGVATITSALVGTAQTTPTVTPVISVDTPPPAPPVVPPVSPALPTFTPVLSIYSGPVNSLSGSFSQPVSMSAAGSMIFTSPAPTPFIASGDGRSGGQLSAISSIGDYAVAAGQTVSIPLPPSTFTSSDPGAQIAVDARQVNGQALPAWMRFDAATGTFYGRPPPGFNGTVNILVTARDSKGQAASTVLRLNVVGTAPRSDLFRETIPFDGRPAAPTYAERVAPARAIGITERMKASTPAARLAAEGAALIDALRERVNG